MANYFGTPGNDFIDPLNSENDYMFGDAGNDTIYGWYGNDTIDGWIGNDILYGEAGSDVLYGGSGNDTLNPGSGVNDFIDGGTGIDLLVADYSNVSDSYSFSFQNIEKVSFKGSNGTDNFTFNNTTDILYGNGGDDMLNAGAFNDYIDGGSGNDTLTGGGFTFNSFEYDTLTGGVGADKFILGDSFSCYYQGAGHALITDFKYVEGDKLQLKGIASQYTESDANLGVGTGALDTGIYKSGNLIAILQDVSGINFILNLDTMFV